MTGTSDRNIMEKAQRFQLQLIPFPLKKYSARSSADSPTGLHRNWPASQTYQAFFS